VDAGEEQTFFCMYCEIQAQKVEIENLMSSITVLQTNLNDLRRKLELVTQPPQASTSQPAHTSNVPTASNIPSSAYPSTTNNERKFNIVVYGVAENPQNTNRKQRMKNDMEKVMEALSETDIDIEPSDIKDLYRLGKYDQNSERPRPLHYQKLMVIVKNFFGAYHYRGNVLVTQKSSLFCRSWSLSKLLIGTICFLVLY